MKISQLCPTLCDPMDCSLPGSSVHRIFQARILEWVVISFSRRASQPRDWTQVSRVVGRRFTIWATRLYSSWNWAWILQWVAFPSGDLPNSEIKPRSPALQVDSLPRELFSIHAEKSFRENSSCVYDKNSPESGNKGDITQHCAVCLVTQSCPILCDPMDCNPLGFFVHGDSLSRNTGLDCHALLQGIFPTQRSNPGLPHCRWIIYCLSHKEAQEYWSE